MMAPFQEFKLAEPGCSVGAAVLEGRKNRRRGFSGDVTTRSLNEEHGDCQGFPRTQLNGGISHPSPEESVTSALT